MLGDNNSLRFNEDDTPAPVAQELSYRRGALLGLKSPQLLRRHLEHGTSSTYVVQRLTQAEQFCSDSYHVLTIPKLFDRCIVKIPQHDLGRG